MPVFQHQNLNSMMSTMVEITSCFLAKWTKCACKDNDKTISIDVHEEMARLTLDILVECVFGTSNRLKFPSKLRIDKSMRDPRRFIQGIIDERKKGFTKSTAKGSIRIIFLVCTLFTFRT
jgi:cytochrome P450